MSKQMKLRIDQGAPLVNHAVVYKKSRNIVCLYVDMVSKYCELVGTGGGSFPCVVVEKTDSTSRFDEIHPDEDTQIEFIDYPGWTVFAASVSKYTIAVTLIKDKK
jgi:hypothetical protein